MHQPTLDLDDGPRVTLAPHEALLRRPCRAHLHVRGHCGDAAAPRLGIIGSRRPTPEQARFAALCARAAVAEGWAVWSGGAIGVDSAAHVAALEAGGVTVCVRPVAWSADDDAPAIVGRLSALGAGVIALAPAGAPVRASAFRARNAVLVAGVDALLVVAAGERSGSLHAAAIAVRKGVPLGVVPWSPASANAAGGHDLLEASGARCVGNVGALGRWLCGVRRPDGGAAGGGSDPAALTSDWHGGAGRGAGAPVGIASTHLAGSSDALGLAVAPAVAPPFDGAAQGWQRYAPAAAVAVPPLPDGMARGLWQALVAACDDSAADGLGAGAGVGGLDPASWAASAERGSVAALLLAWELEGWVSQDRWGRYRVGAGPVAKDGTK